MIKNAITDKEILYAVSIIDDAGVSILSGEVTEEKSSHRIG
jgi:hypothetical protein